MSGVTDSRGGIRLWSGDRMIEDLRSPRKDEIDLEAAWQWCDRNRRFGNDPRALTVTHHMFLVRDLARIAGADRPVVAWAGYHDLHEGVLRCDIPQPLKVAMGGDLAAIEAALDDAIADAAGVDRPTDWVRGEVTYYDRIACWLEQECRLGRQADGEAPRWAREFWLDVMEGRA